MNPARNLNRVKNSEISNSGVKISAIVPAAGSGRRMGSGASRSSQCAHGPDKLFLRLRGRELLYYALKALEDSGLISEVIIAAKAENIPAVKKLINKHRFNKVKEVVKGGRYRSRSVFNALLKISPGSDLVLVHDAARPFVSQALVSKTVIAARRYGAAIAAVPVKPTIKEAGPGRMFISRTLPRRLLWEAQTPQVIRKDLLNKGYEKAGKEIVSFTDEASLVERLGKKVKIIKGDYCNIKITTPDDFIIAEAIMRKKCLSE